MPADLVTTPAAPAAATDGGSSGAAVSAPVSTPAAAPAAPAAAPATSAPASATPAAPAVAAERPAMREGETDAQFVQRFAEWKSKQPAAEAKPEGEAAAPAAGAAPAETKPAEAKPETKPEPALETKPAEGETAAEEDEVELPEEELSLDAVGLPDIKQIADKLKPVFEANPELQGPVMKAMRLASKAADVLQLIPDKESAQFAVENSNTFTDIRSEFSSIGAPADAKNVLRRFAEMSQVIGPDGKPVLENGQPVLHESFGYFVEGVVDDAFEFYRSQFAEAAKNGDERASEVMAAVDVLQGVSKPAPAATEDEIPPHLKQKFAEAERITREAKATEKRVREQAKEQWKESVKADSAKYFDKLIEKAVGHIELPEFNKDYAMAEIAQELGKRMLDNPLFQSLRRNLTGNDTDFTDKTRHAYSALVKRYARESFMDVARPILLKAGGRAKQSAQALAARAASQADASKSEPRGATAPPIGAPAPTGGAGQLPKFREEYRAKFNQLPDDKTEVAWLSKRFDWQTHQPA